MTRLSVNINKVALLRNSRKGNFPDLYKFAQDCEHYGAEGITVHPRPDERHIRYSDIPKLKSIVKTEFNIEGYPNEQFLQLVEENVPDQCTLVPDKPGVLTSDCGWDTKTNAAFLKDVVLRLKAKGIRVSLFVNALEIDVEGAKAVGADRIELYTGDYAKMYLINKENAIHSHKKCATLASNIGIGLNAGHDLNLHNLNYYKSELKDLLEVSIGHALVADALYYGLNNVIGMYKHVLTKKSTLT